MKVSLTEAIKLIKSGHVVALPTETVYGLAAALKHPRAIEKIFWIKQRPPDKPLSLLISCEHHIQTLAHTIPKKFLVLKSLWPGPLTLVMPANCANVPDRVRAGQTSVGLRMPDHSQLLQLIAQTGPLAAPSANPSDAPPATSAKQVEDYFGKTLPILDGGPCCIGVSSTVIKLDGDQFEILREGTIKRTTIEDLIGTSS